MATTITNTPKGDPSTGFSLGTATVEGVEYKFNSITYDGVNWQYAWPMGTRQGRWISEEELIRRIDAGIVPVKNWEGVWTS